MFPPGCNAAEITNQNTLNSIRPPAAAGSHFSFVLFLINVIVLGSSSFSSSSLEYDIPVFEKSGKGGTYPRRYGIPFGLQDYSDGG